MTSDLVRFVPGKSDVVFHVEHFVMLLLYVHKSIFKANSFAVMGLGVTCPTLRARTGGPLKPGFGLSGDVGG